MNPNTIHSGGSRRLSKAPAILALAAVMTAYSLPAHAIFGLFGESKPDTAVTTPGIVPGNTGNAGTRAMPTPPPGAGSLGGFVNPAYAPQNTGESADPCAYIGAALQDRYEKSAQARIPQITPGRAVSESGADQTLKAPIDVGSGFPSVGDFVNKLLRNVMTGVVDYGIRTARNATINRMNDVFVGLGIRGPAQAVINTGIGVATGTPGAVQQGVGMAGGMAQQRVGEAVGWNNPIGSVIGGGVNQSIGQTTGEVNRSITTQQQQQQQQQPAPQQQRGRFDWLTGR
jgi:hypothetical protein